MKKRRPFNETVFFEALLYKIIFFPFRLLSSIGHLIAFIALRLWRIKNVDIPYKKRKRNRK